MNVSLLHCRDTVKIGRPMKVVPLVPWEYRTHMLGRTERKILPTTKTDLLRPVRPIFFNITKVSMISHQKSLHLFCKHRPGMKLSLHAKFSRNKHIGSNTWGITYHAELGTHFAKLVVGEHEP